MPVSSVDLGSAAILDLILPLTYLRLTATPLRPAQDLTGQITRVGPHYFDYGGNADIWEGKWIQKESGRMMEVHIRLPTH